jgi:beta-glucosidase/6-phospho-beta-glucosidase/beta-galactosidase
MRYLRLPLFGRGVGGIEAGNMRSRPTLTSPSTDPGSTGFLWAAGIEDTFISRPDPRTGRTLDEYALTGHYDRWAEDIDLIASLGVPAARYGIPWYRVEPQPGKFDWAWTDRALERLVVRHGVEPIVDLVHYGAPAWLERACLDPDYPQRVASYAHAFATRYRDLCFWYTPLNEPRIHAWYAARIGWWPPHGRSWQAFGKALVALSRGIVETQRAVRSAQPEAVFVHVDATDLYKTSVPGLETEAQTRQAIVFAALDLVQGLVEMDGFLARWLKMQGVPDVDIDWFRSNHVLPDIIGYNMYPMYSEKHVVRGRRGGPEVRIRRCGVATFIELTRMYAQRYGLPVFCTETASDGPPERRVRWIDDSTEAVSRLRAEGVPVVGFTYWPLFSLVGWAYQRGANPLDSYVMHFGLWDLQPDPQAPENLNRIPTSAADRYRAVVASPVQPMGTPSSL